MDEKTDGQVAYEAYSAFSAGRSLISGAPLPAWDAQAPGIEGAWEAAADAVLDANVKPVPVTKCGWCGAVAVRTVEMQKGNERPVIGRSCRDHVKEAALWAEGMTA